MRDDLPVKAKIYLRAAELVEKGHCKGALAQTITNERIDNLETNPRCAAKFCYHGAIIKANFELLGDAEGVREFWRYHEEFGRGTCPAMVDFNDARDTTPAMVAQKLREQAFEE